VPLSEKFWSSFFKSLRGQGRVALGALRRAQNSPDWRFFLIDFSLRLLPAKKNRLWNAESKTRAVYAGDAFFVRKLLERSFPTPFKNFPERFL